MIFLKIFLWQDCLPGHKCHWGHHERAIKISLYAVHQSLVDVLTADSGIHTTLKFNVDKTNKDQSLNKTALSLKLYSMTSQNGS